MTRFPLLPMGRNCREVYLQSIDLPDNYMGDFSLMGIVVGDYPAAAAALHKAGFRLNQLAAGTEVDIESPQHLRQALALLGAQAIDCTFLDIADTLYQA